MKQTYLVSFGLNEDNNLARITQPSNEKNAFILVIYFS